MINIENGRLLYHLTPIENLESILKEGLKSRKSLSEEAIGFLDIANPDIINKRSINGLTNLIPFHFSPYSAFDVAVKGDHPEEYIYICVYRSYAEKNNFLIATSHPLNNNLAPNDLLSYEEGFKQIDWNVMNEHTKNEDTSSNTREVKMAECLSTSTIFAKDFSCIYCNSKYIEHINDLLKKYSLTTNVYEGIWLNEQQD